MLSFTRLVDEKVNETTYHTIRPPESEFYHSYYKEMSQHTFVSNKKNNRKWMKLGCSAKRVSYSANVWFRQCLFEQPCTLDWHSGCHYRKHWYLLHGYINCPYVQMITGITRFTDIILLRSCETLMELRLQHLLLLCFCRTDVHTASCVSTIPI